ncbi:MaoC/PaaZ C-terminal domain-containing protein [uncultured Enterovirga sp.]|uniref:MaoC/PaaZ C-terminal domain-containing protein n=1 Tax=uncultured Enterovirga sp. TaxID=2026352 RepID=UPI0035CB10E9
MTEPSFALAEDRQLFFEDLRAGDVCLSGGRTVTEADIVNFAGVSGDFHALHMDESYAAGTAHGRRMAHGMLVVAMTAGLVVRLPIMRGIERSTLGLAGVNLRFLEPTFIGDTIRVELSVTETRESRKPDRGVIMMRRRVLNQHDQPVVEGDWTLVLRRRVQAITA